MVRKASDTTPNRLLRVARQERGWTQKQVADFIDAPLSLNISRWESGTATPNAHYMQQLCHLFGKSPKELGFVPDANAQKSLTSAAGQDEHSSVGTVPSPLWSVPYRRNPFFTGREALLTHLHTVFTQAPAGTAWCALHGLGGVGKTQMALEYAYRYRHEYHIVFWLRAATQQTLLFDITTLAYLLHIPERDVQNQRLMVLAVKQWLDTHTGWLLILDNADTFELIEDFLPTAEEGGHVLLTTRTLADRSPATALEVETMDSAEGSLLLLRRAKVLSSQADLNQATREDQAGAEAIVKAVDGLPLALEQAGAYIEETSCGLAEYLNLYQHYQMDLLNRPSRIAPMYPSTVATTWSLSFQQVERASRTAADLLHLCAFLAPDAIPEEMLVEGSSALGPHARRVIADTSSLNEARDVLRRFSFIRYNADAKIVSIHRLVQAVLKDELNVTLRQQWSEFAVCLVSAAFPEVTFPNWSRCQQYLPHAQVCAELIEEQQFTFSEAAQLLSRAGEFLEARGQYVQAELLLRQALAIREQTLGPEHPDTITTYDVLALLYRNQGHHAQADDLMKQVLALKERVLGSEHTQTATTLNNLAELYMMQGQYKQAEPLVQRALSIREQILSPDHPDTSVSLSNLAHCYRAQEQYVQAEPLMVRSLAMKERTLGPEHPSTAATLNNLAQIYMAQNLYEQAEPLMQRSLAICEKALGNEHPDTAAMLGNVARLYRKQGRYSQAEVLLQRALTICTNVLPPEHLYTAAVLNQMAQLYVEQEQYTQAEPILRRAIAIREKLLGPAHTYTIDLLQSYALLLERTQRKEEAAQLEARIQANRDQQE